MNTQARVPQRSVLSYVSDRLGSPLPRRTRFLRELAYDLQELTGQLVAQGLSPDEARRRASEALVPDTQTLARLRDLQLPWYRRVTRGLDSRRLRLLERFGLAAAVTTLLVMESSAILRADLVAHASPFLWVVQALGGVLVACVLAKWFQLWIKRDHRNPRAGLGTILGLSLTTLGVGFAGALVDIVLLLARLEAAPQEASGQLLTALIRDASLVSVAMLFSLAGAVGWLVSTQWIDVVQDAHERALALESSFFEEV